MAGRGGGVARSAEREVGSPWNPSDGGSPELSICDSWLTARRLSAVEELLVCVPNASAIRLTEFPRTG